MPAIFLPFAAASAGLTLFIGGALVIGSLMNEFADVTKDVDLKIKNPSNENTVSKE